MKKIISIALSLMMAFNAFAVSTLADESPAVEETAVEETATEETAEERDYTEAEKAAEALKSLGLFKGVSDTDFDLDRAPTRTEAMVMLIRILGKEAEALNGEFKHPFTDVASWADKYIGYAYENGLTNGISATEFGASDASAAMYLTFVLRALGYSDANGEDFTWDAPFELAKTAGILTDGVNTDEFFRADVALVSYNALEAVIKGTEQTLAEKLIEDGAFTEEQYLAVAVPAPEAHPTVDLSAFNIVSDFTEYSHSAGLDGNGFFEGVRALDYVTLPDYKNSENVKNLFTVTEEEIDEQIDTILEEYAIREEITDRAVAADDTVNFSIIGYINGVIVEDMTYENTDDVVVVDEEEVAAVKLMVKDYYSEKYYEAICGLIDCMIDTFASVVGKMPGDKVVGEFDASEYIKTEDGAEYKFRFEITINHIVKITEAELTVEIANDYGFESIEELRADIAAWLADVKYTELITGIVDNSVCDEIPSGVMEYHINSALYQIYYNAMSSGVSFDYILQVYGCAGVDELIGLVYDSVVESAKTDMIYQAIAEAEGLTVPEELLNSDEYSYYVPVYGAPYVKHILLGEVVIADWFTSLLG